MEYTPRKPIYSKSKSEFIPPKGTRTYHKRPQCAAVFKNTGNRCRYYALEGNLHCKRHAGINDPTGSHLKTPEAEAKRQAFFAKLREAAKTDPTIMSAVHSSHRSKESYALGTAKRAETMKRRQEGLPDPPPDDRPKDILKADRILAEEKIKLPAVPDKPFEQMEPHEQLVVVTGQSLNVLTEILKIPFKKSVVQADGTIEEVHDLKAAALVKDTAVRTIGLRVKVDTNALNAKRADKVLDVLERLKAEAAKSVGGRVIDN